MNPAQLSLEFDAPPPLRAKYPNPIGWAIVMAVNHGAFRYPAAIRPALWVAACGHVVVGIRGGTQ